MPGESPVISPFTLLPPNRVWRTYPGGKVLDAWEGKERPADSFFPEDWIGSITRATNIGREHVEDEGLARIASSTGGQFLADLIQSEPEYYLGPAHLSRFGADPRFLLKYLDTSIRLHVQVHPTAEFARAHLNSGSGKTEGYYILGSRSSNANPVIHIGFRETIKPEVLAGWVIDQEIDALLGSMHSVPVSPGDCFIVPGGVPHAIGAELYMIEVMEPSDLAIRFEFERGGYLLPERARFMDRGLPFAISMTDLSGHSLSEIMGKCQVSPRLVEHDRGIRHEMFFDAPNTDKFTLRRYTGSGSTILEAASYGIMVVARGNCTAESPGALIELNTHDRCAVAAGAGPVELTLARDSEVLIYGPPHPRR